MIPFHSEVGLCSSAFKKLSLAGEPKRSKKAPNVKRGRKTNKHNLANKPSSPAKKPKGTVLFQNRRNNNNNSNNNKNATKKNKGINAFVPPELLNLM
jgi:hypothetical protein